MNKITLVGRPLAGAERGKQQPEGLPEASIAININLEFGPDSPPALVEAIGKGIAEMLKVWGKDDELQRIAQECDDIRSLRHGGTTCSAWHQRQADHATQLLLSRPTGPEETEPDNSLAEAIRWRRCYKCEEPYGRAAVAGCSECQPIRVLLGMEASQP